MEGITCLTFDCYGTLIDWDGGIRAAAGELASLADCDLARLLVDRERVDAELITGPYRSYDAVLRESLRSAAADQGCEVTDAEAARFAASMGSWPPFPDSRAALQRLRARYRLGILSNVRTAVLARSVEQLGVAFDAIVTAEQIESYKPARAHFDEALARLGVESHTVLHVAGSLWHDVRPALALGWRCAWVDRRGEGLPGGGTSEEPSPTWVVGSMAELVERLGP